MVRTFFALSMVALFAMATGCHMLSHPYDYCGPLYDGEGGQYCCCPNARAGSILSPNPMGNGTCTQCGKTRQVIEDGVAPQPIPQHELTRTRPSDSRPLVLGSGNLVEAGPTLFQASPDANRAPMPSVGGRTREYPRNDPSRWAGGQHPTARQR